MVPFDFRALQSNKENEVMQILRLGCLLDVVTVVPPDVRDQNQNERNVGNAKRVNQSSP